MSAPVTRNSFKGYTFQQQVFTFFAAIMDLDREILSVEAEAVTPGNFDDLHVVLKDDSFRVQVKNYPSLKLRDIHVHVGASVQDSFVETVARSRSSFDPAEKNLYIVNTDDADTNSAIFTLPALQKNGVWLVPLTEKVIEDYLSSNYNDSARILEVIHLADRITVNGRFLLRQEDLPPLARFGLELEEATIPVHPLPESFPKGITWIVGKPGVGKSHYVTELKNAFPEAVFFRFWVGSQDPEYNHRLQYSNFLSDLAKALFKSPRKFTEEEIRAYVIENNVELILDGLDHVENYNSRELSHYVDFINSIRSASVIVLSRPLKSSISWNKDELFDWSFDQTQLYLNHYGVTGYSVQQGIYQKTNGYPLLLFYFKEHYLKTGEIYDQTNASVIADLDDYYSSLLKEVNTKNCLAVFSAMNSFVTWTELKRFAGNELILMVIENFIADYPYLFKRVENRISLIHDSFNTFLRERTFQDESFAEQRQQWIQKIEDSILSGNVEYMARINSFPYEATFHEKVYHQYANLETFRKLLESTIDYESIQSFYRQLKAELPYHPDILSIEEYYSFALIVLMTERNNLSAYEGLVYQILNYQLIHKPEIPLSDQIFSSGIMWSLFVLFRTKDQRYYERVISDNHFDQSQANQGYKELWEEIHFFDSEKPHKNKVKKEIRASFDDYSDILIRYFTACWLRGEQFPLEHQLIEDYLRLPGLKYAELNMADYLVREFQIKNNDFLAGWVLSGVRYRLYELGEFGQDNFLRTFGIRDSMRQILQNGEMEEGSFTVCERLQSVLRLANQEKRELDICYINYAWCMYDQRKDMSVITLPEALLVFERHRLITEKASLNLLVSARNMSEKGISWLVNDYINQKGTDFVTKLLTSGWFEENAKSVFALDLDSSLLNCFPSKKIRSLCLNLLGCRPHDRMVEYRDIRNVLKSRHRDTALDILSQYNVRVYDVEEDSCSAEEPSVKESLQMAGITFTEEAENSIKTLPKKYVPFENGHISEEDFPYIQKNNISPLEVASYTDGWDFVMPYVEIYKQYAEAEIQRIARSIISMSMFARVRSIDMVGAWDYLPGSIPQFLEQEHIPVDWQKIFSAFMGYMQMSLIERDGLRNG